MTVAARLARHLATGAEHGATLGADHRALWQALTAAAEGGKRFRPALVVAVHRALGGQEEPAVLEVAAAVELLHTAFVIHDDVIDGDDTRRGRLNVSGTFAADARTRGADERHARTLGTTAGILAGDLALGTALRAVALCGAPPAQVRRLLDLFDRALHVSAAGELADVRLSLALEDPALGEILTMAEHKTAVYSFELPMQAGAVLAGADEDTIARVGEVGRLLGIAFQLHDDLLGVFGAEEDTGKSTTTDLREGKRTPLIAHASTTDAWPEIAARLGSPDLDEDGATQLRVLLEGCGSRAFIEELLTSYTTAAVRLAGDVALPADLMTWVSRLSTDLEAA